MECCKNCKFLYPLKKFVNGDWEYSHVCLLFPFTEEKDELCYAMVIKHPEVQMCEMFDEREMVNAWSRIKALGKDLRTFRDGITDENTLVGFNMAVALCNKHLGERREDYELGITD